MGAFLSFEPVGGHHGAAVLFNHCTLLRHFLSTGTERIGGDVDTRALANEVIAEALDLDVRDYLAPFDLWIDKSNTSTSERLLLLHLKTSRSDQNRIASLHELGMPLGKLQTQNIVVGRDHGDTVARGDMIAFHDGERCDRSPDAGPSKPFMDRLDHGDHSLLIINRPQAYGLLCGEADGQAGIQLPETGGREYHGDDGKDAGHAVGS